MGFPGGPDSIKSDCIAGDLGFDPWVGKIPQRREWQPNPVSLPGEFHGQRSLVGYSPWGCEELDITDQLTHTHTHTHTSALSLLLRLTFTFGILQCYQKSRYGLLFICPSRKLFCFLNLRINFLGQFWKCFILIFENYLFLIIFTLFFQKCY